MQKQYPWYFKCTVVLLGLILFVFAIFTIREILVPLSFALLISILLNPMVNWFQKKKLPKIFAISLALLIAFLFIGGIGYFLSMQIAGFTDQLPLMKKKLIDLVEKLQHDISSRFNIDVEKQQKALEEAGAGMKPLIGSTAGTLMN